MKTITLHLPVSWIKLMKELDKEEIIANRAEFIRSCIWAELKNQFPERKIIKKEKKRSYRR